MRRHRDLHPQKELPWNRIYIIRPEGPTASSIALVLYHRAPAKRIGLISVQGTMLKAGGVSTNVWLRVSHNTALKLDWLMRRVLAEAAWPKVRYGITRAITAEEPSHAPPMR